MDEVFRALADPNRRRLLDTLNLRDGQTLGELCAVVEMTRQSVSKHLAALEAAGLVTTVRHGRHKLHHLDTQPIDALFDRWIRQYHRPRPEPPPSTARRPMPEPNPDAFVYPIYIRTTPERLWQAITGPEFSRRHMGHALISTWQKGAAYTWIDGDVEIADVDQVVVDVDPYRRLSLVFPVSVPSMTGGADPTEVERAARSSRSHLSFDIEPAGEQVELTVAHDGFGADRVVREAISRVWPRKLSDLKSGLEQTP
ncbi:ArsR/SmtB family transcription factor [Mycolicibacterium litorale]|uniref:ArsR/SmtB family transcription factor n=1 Tax=Mycolicibacterium litorale TaxID=758802 RepID=UPI0039A2BCEA